MTIKKLLYVLVLPLLLLTGNVMAQDKVVTGKVTDSAGAAIANASVLVKGGTTGSQTNADGTFSLKVPASAKSLTVTSVGFGSVDIPIIDGPLSVTLRSANTSLSEVVVIGYGSTRKKDLTGSVAVITSKDFQRGNITTPEQLIAGKVAGVSIISNGGQPGSGSQIRIRGGSSLNASNDPLIVIDGVPLAQSGIAGAGNPLSFINPNDIESFTVLKDASSAAIYGSRAANGVIIITTKKGKGGGLKLNFSSNLSVSNIAKKVDVFSGDEVRKIVNENGSPARIAQLGQANTDWQNEIYQSAISSDNNLSISGGIKSLPYRVTLGYQHLNGILKTDKLERTSLALALSPAFLDNHLKFDINLKGIMQKTRFANQGAIGGAVSFDPTQPVRTTDKRYGGFFEWRESDGSLILNRGNNPVGLLEQTFDDQKPMRSIGNAQIDYKFHFFPDLHANLNVGYDVSKNTGTRFVSDSAASNYETGGVRSQGKQTKTNTLLDFYFNYVKDIKSIKSRIDVTTGYSYNNFQTKDYNFRSYKANGDTFPSSKPVQFDFNLPENTLVSYFGRLNFNYNDKYLFTATVRRDGSSKFSRDNRWGTFPSMALSWRINNEPFLKNSTLISDLKLRVGYGITGQQEGIGFYDYIARYGIGGISNSYIFGQDTVIASSPFGYNASLKWETTTTYNAAIDFAFAKGRINGSVDFYLRKTKDLLNSVPQPTGTNFALYILSNVGSMENKGVEFNLNVQPIQNKITTLDLNFNATYNKNTVTNLTVVPNDPTYKGLPGSGAAGYNGAILISQVGGPRNTFYLYKQVYDQNDKPIEGLFEDLNRDGIITPDDRYLGQAADPNLFLGFSPNLGYKKFNFGFVMRASFNNYVYNNVYSNLGRLNQIAGSYTVGNGSANYLETGFTGKNAIQGGSDYYVQNASFLRMDNISIGYNVGKISRGKAVLRISGNIQNVFVVTKYSGLDPELNNGVDNNLYPRPRTYTIGFNLDF